MNNSLEFGFERIVFALKLKRLGTPQSETNVVKKITCFGTLKNILFLNGARRLLKNSSKNHVGKNQKVEEHWHTFSNPAQKPHKLKNFTKPSFLIAKSKNINQRKFFLKQRQPWLSFSLQTFPLFLLLLICKAGKTNQSLGSIMPSFSSYLRGLKTVLSNWTILNCKCSSYMFAFLSLLFSVVMLVNSLLRETRITLFDFFVIVFSFSFQCVSVVRWINDRHLAFEQVIRQELSKVQYLWNNK